ncbi:hypothetical protein BH09BAC5_BH09BAC5_02530 [soil metagenome]
MRQPPITLVNLTPEEKERIEEISRKQMVRGITIYLIPFIIFGFLVGYTNVFYEKFGMGENPDLRGWVNVGLVFLTILPARLFVNVILRRKKVMNAWQKKVIRGVIQAKEGKIITAVNQKIKLSAEQADKVKTGDNVIVSAMPGGEFVLDIEILEPES